jgi:hypothetical protein
MSVVAPRGPPRPHLKTAPTALKKLGRFDTPLFQQNRPGSRSGGRIRKLGLAALARTGYLALHPKGKVLVLDVSNPTFRSLGEVLGERNLVRLFLEYRAKQR